MGLSLTIIYFEVESAIMGLDYIKLGLRIKDRRKRLGYTQKRLAELIHVSEQHVPHIETAHTKPSLEVIVDIAEALQTDVNSFLVDSLPATQSNVLINRVIENISDLQHDELELAVRIVELIKEYRLSGDR